MRQLILVFMTAHADQINGALEFGGSFFVFNNCRMLYLHKMVRGVSAITVGFFFAWGIWNTIWYPFLHQPWSFIGGALMAFSNFANVSFMVYYKYMYKGNGIK